MAMSILIALLCLGQAEDGREPITALYVRSFNIVDKGNQWSGLELENLIPQMIVLGMAQYKHVRAFFNKDDLERAEKEFGRTWARQLTLSGNILVFGNTAQVIIEIDGTADDIRFNLNRNKIFRDMDTVLTLIGESIFPKVAPKRIAIRCFPNKTETLIRRPPSLTPPEEMAQALVFLFEKMAPDQFEIVPWSKMEIYCRSGIDDAALAEKEGADIVLSGEYTYARRKFTISSQVFVKDKELISPMIPVNLVKDELDGALFQISRNTVDFLAGIIDDQGRAMDFEMEGNDFRHIESDYRNGNYSMAMFRIENALKKWPDEPQVYYYKGLVLSALERNEEALASFRKAGESIPEALPAMVDTLIKLEDLDQAIHLLEDLTARKDPPDLPLCMKKGDILYLAREYPRAEKTYLFVLDHTERDTEIYQEAAYLLGNVYMVTDREEEAVARYLDAGNFQPARDALFDHYNNRGSQALAEDAYDVAVDLLSKALEYRQNPDLHAQRGLAALGRPTRESLDLAVSDFETALRHTSEFELKNACRVHLPLANVLLGNYDRALKEARKAFDEIKKQPEYTIVANLLIVICQRMSGYEYFEDEIFFKKLSKRYQISDFDLTGLINHFNNPELEQGDRETILEWIDMARTPKQARAEGSPKQK
ncbi:MAG: tetratricopeptide repeat protein [Acidobacteriota bacterium]|nr:tetratricopeptide repeat protein [Acidobacteriota bacterium]